MTDAAHDARPGEPILRLDSVVKYYSPSRSAHRHGLVHAVDGVSLELSRGETVGLVGESGCGKSTLARCATRLVDVTEGSIMFEGQDITRANHSQLRPVRRHLQMIFQDPSGSLNARRRVGSVIRDPLAIHRIGDKFDRRQRVQQLMELVGLNPEHYNRFPGEFSGGQRQRIGVARALATEPSVLVCDEPVSALDVSVQAQIINLFKDLQQRLGLTYLFIAHDLAVVEHMSNRIAVMYLGKIVEVGPSEEVTRRPRHPYTHALLSALPVPDPDIEAQRQRVVLRGEPPSPIGPSPGCRFVSRCPFAEERCAVEEPPLRTVLEDDAVHQVACHFPLGDKADAVQATAPQPAGRSVAEGVAMSTGEHTAAMGPGHQRQDRDLQLRDLPAASRIEGRSPWALAWQRLRHDRVAIGSAVVIVLVTLMAICAPLIAKAVGHGPIQQFPRTGLTIAGLPRPPSATFLFGTDDLGRDLLVRVAYGARISLLVGVAATGLAVPLGVVVGLLSGYFGGHTDSLLARLMDIVLSFPLLLFAIALVAIVGPSLPVTILLIAFFSWAPVGRVVRGQTLALKEREFVEAARSLGASNSRIVSVDILPNLAAPIIVYATLLVPAAIAFEATLSFLGLGVVPPTAEWGNMLAQAVGYYQVAWWFLVFPGAALIVTTLAFNLLGDSVRDALDPRAGALFGVRTQAPPLTVGLED